jgi:hypothetical protein
VYSGGFRNALEKFVLFSKIYLHLIHHLQYCIEITQTRWTIDHNSFKTSSKEWTEDRYWYSVTPIRSVHSVCELSVLEIIQANLEIRTCPLNCRSVDSFRPIRDFQLESISLEKGTSLDQKRESMKWTNARVKWHSLTNCEIKFGKTTYHSISE